MLVGKAKGKGYGRHGVFSIDFGWLIVRILDKSFYNGKELGRFSGSSYDRTRAPSLGLV